MAKKKAEKKRPGPEPELISIHPICFDQAVETLLHTKPKKRSKNDKNDQQLAEIPPVNHDSNA